MTVIAIYLPTLHNEPSAKDASYNERRDLANGIPRRDILLIAGDRNAHTEPADEYNHHTNNLASVSDETIANSWSRLRISMDYWSSPKPFQHPKKYLLTWHSNGVRAPRRISYTLVRSVLSSSIEDCRAYRGRKRNRHGPHTGSCSP